MKYKAKLWFRVVAAGSLLWAGSLSGLSLPVRELVHVSSLRQNQLVGYGLVVGLPQSGDSRNFLAPEALKKILAYHGIQAGDKLASKNIAAVMVMAELPAFARSGDNLDVWVSSVGDAKSLRGGFLLQTPLAGADGSIYAVAQGRLAPASEKKGMQSGDNTVRVLSGAVMEKSISQPLSFQAEDQSQVIRLGLRHFDVSNASSVITAINKKFKDSATLAKDGSIEIRVPEQSSPLEFLARVYEIPVEVKAISKVVIDPRSATIVMGGSVGISAVAVTKSGITIEIKKKNETEKKNVSSLLLQESPTVAELVDALNQLGLGANDIIDILQAIDAAGALHGELVIM